MCAVANSVIGILGDTMPEKDYKEKSVNMDDLEKYLLQFAKEMDCKEMIDEFEGKIFLDDDFYSEIMDTIISDYDDHILFDSLANELAKRDFHRDHSKEEIKKMAKKNGGYFGVALHDYEKKYWDEFEKHGMERLVIAE